MTYLAVFLVLLALTQAVLATRVNFDNLPNGEEMMLRGAARLEFPPENEGPGEVFLTKPADGPEGNSSRKVERLRSQNVERFQRLSFSEKAEARTVLTSQATGPVVGNDEIHDVHERMLKVDPSASLAIFHGGPVVKVANIYSVFMGSDDMMIPLSNYWNQYVTGLTGSRHFNILQQYLNNKAPKVVWRKSYFIPNSISNLKCPAVQWGRVQKDYQKYICDLRTPNPGDMYFIFVNQTRPVGCQACGWHDFITCDTPKGKVTIYPSFMYNIGKDWGCCTNCRPTVGTYRDGKVGGAIPEPHASIINVAGHELFAAMTDPLGTAWWNPYWAEIPDPCSWRYGTPSVSTLENGKKFNLQQMWSNKARGCVSGA